MATVIVEFHNQAGLWRGLSQCIRCRPGIASRAGSSIRKGARFVRHKAIADPTVNHSSGLVASFKARHVDGILIGAYRQSTRRVCEKTHDPQRRSAHAVTSVCRVKNPDVGAGNSRRCHFRIASTRDIGQGRICALLPTMGSCNKCLGRVTSKNNIAWFVAN